MVLDLPASLHLTIKEEEEQLPDDSSTQRWALVLRKYLKLDFKLALSNLKMVMRQPTGYFRCVCPNSVGRSEFSRAAFSM